MGIHLNALGVQPNTDPGTPPLSADEQAFLKSMEALRSEESGYQAIQSTRPQTLAYALSDSPIGLAAWIVDQFRAWGDYRGEVESRNIQRWTNMPRGGHFAAMEEPGLFVEDVRSFFRRFR